MPLCLVFSLWSETTEYSKNDILFVLMCLKIIAVYDRFSPKNFQTMRLRIRASVYWNIFHIFDRITLISKYNPEPDFICAKFSQQADMAENIGTFSILA